MSETIDTTWHDLMQPHADPDTGRTLLAELPERRVIEVTGTEARAFLHAILTQDINALGDDTGNFAALCSAKGRALGLLRIVAHDDGFRLVTRADLAAGLLKRLQMYVLRRDVQLSLAEDQAAIGILWPGSALADCPFDDADACATIERLQQAEPSPGQWPAAVDAHGRLFLREDNDTSQGMRLAIHGPTATLVSLVRAARDHTAIAATDHWERAEIEDRVPEVTTE
ncbi:MAG: YgfZ/GcvT domain-containing protein, partial [Guyparkeria sp.]